MTTNLALMVPGADSHGGVVEVRAPFDSKLIATLDAATSTTIEQALASANALFRDRSRWLSRAQRIEILVRTAELMDQQAPVLARLATQEGGKPLQDSRVEVARAIDGVRNCVDCLRASAGREIPMGLDAASSGRLAYTRHEPIGPVVAVSAFNHPLNLIVHQVAPAIAAGNPVIVKPAEDTPLSCYRFVQLLHAAGLPEHWCQVLVVNHVEVATQLVTDPRVAFFSFIGSSRVGWMLRSKLAPGTRCALEHGGAAPVIVDAGADIDQAIPLLTRGGFYHAGQVCVSVQRVFCHDSIVRDMAERLACSAKNLRVGDPLLETTEVGPLIRYREVNRVHEWVLEARSAGAEVLTGGNTLTDSCYAPTVLFNPPDHVRVSQQEIFGPVVCVYSFTTMDEAIARANALPFAFQASVFTRDLDRALYASGRLDASAVMVNDHTAFRVDWMPFAGLRQSGLGTGGIPCTFHEMQTTKMTVLFVNCPYPTLGQDAVPVGVVTIGPHCSKPYTTSSLFNISGMSYGAISTPAVLALSNGARMAGCWMNTGEGGLSPCHLEGGADIVFQIGTAKYGVRDAGGKLDDDRLRAIATHTQVKMFEIKLSQGAKPGKGGILPGGKVTAEIAAIRGIPEGADSISPNRHPEINNEDDLLDMIAHIREVTGKPVGFKTVIGAYGWIEEMCKAILRRGIEHAPDFITIDSADGGTGAAPMSLIDYMGLPIRESLPIVLDTMTAYGLKDRIKVVASGKLITPADVAWALCLGADFICSARGFMFALGCIQALQCDRNTCPTGITTHNKRLQKGLDATVKAERVRHYVDNMVYEVGVIAHSCGVREPRELQRHHARIVTETGRSFPLSEIYHEPAVEHSQIAAAGHK